MEPSVAYNHATIFSAKRIDNKICYQHSDVNNKQSRHGFYSSGLNQESTQDERCIFGEEGHPDASENKEYKKSNIGGIFYKGGNGITPLVLVCFCSGTFEAVGFSLIV